MTIVEQSRQPNFAITDDREVRLFLRLPFVMLVVATALAAGVDGSKSAKLLPDLGLAVAAFVWMGLMYRRRSRWPEHPWLNCAWFAVLLALMAALVLHDGLFGFFSWTGYVWAALAIPVQLRFLGFVGVALITATSQHGGLPHHSLGSWAGWASFVAINLGASTAISWIARERELEHERREATIGELQKANQKLAASLQENAGLHAQLLAQSREAGVLDERQRMAGEIHDTIAQGLVGIITQLEAASHASPFEDAWRRHAEAAIELARDSLSEARRSVQALVPVPLEEEQLPDALTTVAEKWSALSGISAAVTTTGTVRRMRPEIELALLRTAQEALANVAKHAEAQRVGVTLSYMEDVVTLDVRDDGSGFTDSAPRNGNGGGFGLTAMRQRVEGLAGTLEVESEPGGGTTIAASIPAIPAGSVA